MIPKPAEFIGRNRQKAIDRMRRQKLDRIRGRLSGTGKMLKSMNVLPKITMIVTKWSEPDRHGVCTRYAFAAGTVIDEAVIGQVGN